MDSKKLMLTKFELKILNLISTRNTNIDQIYGYFKFKQDYMTYQATVQKLERLNLITKADFGLSNLFCLTNEGRNHLLFLKKERKKSINKFILPTISAIISGIIVLWISKKLS